MIPRFLIKENSVKEGRVTLDRDETRHAVSVLRLKNGDAVNLFDGCGKEYRGVITSLNKGLLEVSIAHEPTHGGAVPAAQVTLAVGVIKPERMELLIQKSCELGVFEIFPVLSE